MADEQLDEGIRFEGRMPIAWTAHSAPLTGRELHSINDNNFILLNAITFLEEQAYQEMHDHSVLAEEIMRLDAKLDLLMSLVSRLIVQNQLVPPDLDIVLSSTSIRWKGDLGASPGDEGIVDLYLHPAVAAPLALPASVKSEGMARIHGLSAAVQGALEKYLFRQHRRAIAKSRRPHG